METKPLCSEPTHDDEEDPDILVPDADLSGHKSSIEREVPSGRPLCAVPASSVEALASGDHIILVTSEEPYRPCYQSALVVETDRKRGRILVIRNGKEGANKDWIHFSPFHQVHIVQYTVCRYSDEEAIRRAEQRVKWGECYFHPLYNNSHHFTSWAKTGRELPLSNIIKDLEYAGNVYPLIPILSRATPTSLVDLKPGDHIMIKSRVSDLRDEHWLVEAVDNEQQKYTALTWGGDKVVRKELKWEASNRIFRIEYNDCTTLHTLQQSIKNAENTTEMRFSSSDEFVTMMKIGRKYMIGEHCLFSAGNGPVSYTRVTPDIAVDEGDHLVVKNPQGIYQSILIYKYIGEGIVVTMPDFNTPELYGEMDLSQFSEVYRINYKEVLPVDIVLSRACSQVGEGILKICKNEADQFVSWAKTGKQTSVDVAKLQQQCKPQMLLLRPWQREKVVSIDEIQVGDHLIQSYPGRWFHFMVTECHTDPNDPYKVKAIYCFRTFTAEKEIHINPSKHEIHKVVYPEVFPKDVAIERARSRLGTREYNPLARMWFVRWAKTGSDEGLEVDFLSNNALPAIKSRIYNFAQLNQGDYIVEKKQKLSRWHHYLVTEIHSPTLCSVIESWGTPSPETITESDLNLEEGSIFYRLNYNDGACVTPECSISIAREMKGKTVPPRSSYTRQRFVNFVKTGDASVVSVDELHNDRLFLRRERVESALDLCPGDHVECVMHQSGKLVFNHMLVTETIDKQTCKLVHFHAHSPKSGKLFASKKGSMQEEEINLFEEGDVYRICYPERVPPKESIQLMRKSLDDGTSLDTKGIGTNISESFVTHATIGEPVSLQVDDRLHNTLEYSKASALKPIGVALSCHTKASSETLTSINISSKISLKTAFARAGAKAAIRGTFKVGTRAALSGTAVGAVGGTGAGVILLVEGPLLARGIYKLHRKKQFDHVSETEYKQGVIKETFTSVNTVIGGIGGAIVGQILIPVPGIGAAIGGAVGTVSGQICGTAEGWAASKLVREKIVTLPVVVRCTFMEIPNLKLSSEE